MQPSWEATNGQPFDVHGLPFNPPWIWRRSDFAANGASELRLQGGSCATCVAAKIMLPTAAVIGFCPLARIEFTRAKKFMPVRIFCPAGDAAPPPPRLGNNVSAHWHVGAFDRLPYDWQHHVVNAAPHFALSLPLVEQALRSGEETTVTVLHTGMLHHPNVIAAFPRPPRVQELNLLDLRKSGRFAFEFANFVIGFSVGGPHDWYTRGAYEPFASASRQLLSPARIAVPPRQVHVRPVVAWLSRSSAAGSPRTVQNEASVATALRHALCTLGYDLRIVTSDAPAQARDFASFRGVIGVHGGAFANVHACRPGTVVIEMQSDQASSARWCYAALSSNLDLRYFAYFPTRFPRDYMTADVEARRVVVDPQHFSNFVRDAFAAAGAVDGLPPNLGEVESGHCDRQSVTEGEPQSSKDMLRSVAAEAKSQATRRPRQEPHPRLWPRTTKLFRPPPPPLKSARLQTRRQTSHSRDAAQPLRQDLATYQDRHCIRPSAPAHHLSDRRPPNSEVPIGPLPPQQTDFIKEARAQRCESSCDALGESRACAACHPNEEVIPNVVHYVWIGAGCPPRRATLSLATARLVLAPSAIYLWTLNGSSCDFTSASGATWHAFGAVQKAVPSWPELAQSLGGERGATGTLPDGVQPDRNAKPFCNLQLSRHAAVAHAHYSDLVRMHALLTIGGLYLDGDGFVLRNLSRWRRCDFVMGHDLNDQAVPRLSNGLMLGRPGAAFGRQWAARLSFGWDGSGWDAHSCSLPWTECARAPDGIAATARLRTVAPPESWPSGAGAALQGRDGVLAQFLENDVDGFHTSAFNGWAHEAPQTLWSLLSGALRLAVGHAGGMRALSPAQAVHVEALLRGGISGIYDGRTPLVKSDSTATHGSALSSGRSGLQTVGPHAAGRGTATQASTSRRRSAPSIHHVHGRPSPTVPEALSIPADLESVRGPQEASGCNLPQAAMDITAKALVISYLFGYTATERASILRRYLGSLRASCSRCAATILHDGGLCDEVAQGFNARCATRRLQAAPPPPPVRRRVLRKERPPGAPGSEARFLLFADYLREVGSAYRWVLITDLRDVTFQANPFAFLATQGMVRGRHGPGDGECFRTEQLFVFAEPTVLLHGDEVMHANGCKACLPEAQCDALAPMPLLNLGLLLGTPHASEEAMRLLATTLADRARASPECWDQSVFNFLAYHGGLTANASTRVVGVYAEVGPYGTVGVGPSIHVDRGGAVVDAQGVPYLLLHQFDRYPELAKVLREAPAVAPNLRPHGPGGSLPELMPLRAMELAGRTLQKPTPTLGRVRSVSRACDSLHRLSPALEATGCRVGDRLIAARRAAVAPLPIFELELRTPAFPTVVAMAPPGPGTSATLAASQGRPGRLNDCVVRPPLTIARATAQKFPMAVYGCTGKLWNATSHVGCIDVVSRDILVTGQWEISNPAEMARGLPVRLPARGGTFLDVRYHATPLSRACLRCPSQFPCCRIQPLLSAILLADWREPGLL